MALRARSFDFIFTFFDMALRAKHFDIFKFLIDTLCLLFMIPTFFLYIHSLILTSYTSFSMCDQIASCFNYSFDIEITHRAAIRPERACVELDAPIQNGSYISLNYIGQKGRFPDGKILLFCNLLLFKACVRRKNMREKKYIYSLFYTYLYNILTIYHNVLEQLIKIPRNKKGKGKRNRGKHD